MPYGHIKEMVSLDVFEDIMDLMESLFKLESDVMMIGGPKCL